MNFTQPLEQKEPKKSDSRIRRISAWTVLGATIYALTCLLGARFRQLQIWAPCSGTVER